ncbi:hypothetical protein HO173_007034 [Letharia columbiana]|uniref:Uncharacterized protein n=1 Tax=Letharia columbiana TaxID=112416 RepID=A0A8H6FU61_9LECA|nr:uncharacterized protein HO173_007034 [Letharia columbiana]KAF6234814.1 hypothetical protein HO173_007034 [Letharia columbiana]
MAKVKIPLIDLLRESLLFTLKNDSYRLDPPNVVKEASRTDLTARLQVQGQGWGSRSRSRVEKSRGFGAAFGGDGDGALPSG